MGVHPAPADHVAARAAAGSTRPNRASSGPASRIEARIRAQSAGSSGFGRDRARCRSARVLGPVHSTAAPRSREQREHASRRRGCGARCRARTGPSASSVAARIGKRGVLVAGGADGAAQGAAAADLEAWRHGQSSPGAAGPSSASGLCLAQDVAASGHRRMHGSLAGWARPSAISLVIIALAFAAIALVVAPWRRGAPARAPELATAVAGPTQRRLPRLTRVGCRRCRRR